MSVRFASLLLILVTAAVRADEFDEALKDDLGGRSDAFDEL